MEKIMRYFIGLTQPKLMHTQPSGKSPGLSSVNTYVNEPQLMKLIVEELAQARRNIGVAGINFDNNLLGIDSSTTQTFLTGRVNLQYGNIDLAIPFITSFVFTCVKSSRSYYEIEWAMSLS